MINLKYRNVNLTEAETFKLKVLDAYREMQPKNARYLCRLFGIGKSTFYRWIKEFNQARLPGELVQVDTKFLPKKKYQYTAIDVVSKWRVSRI